MDRGFVHKRKLLIKVVHKLIDALAFPIFIFAVLTVAGFILAYLLSIGPHHENFIEVFLGCTIIALILFLFFAIGFIKIGVYKDEELWLVGDEVECIKGDKKFRERVKNINEIYLSYKRFAAPIILFITKNVYDFFDIGFDHALRKWCTPEELEEIGIKIWRELRKINPEIRLKRKFYTTGYREEYYDGEKWIPVKK